MADPKSVKKSDPKPGQLVPALNGGKIRHGSLPGNTPGTGRPPDAIRAAMRELGATKGLPFLGKLLDGEVEVTLFGKCPSCGKVSKASAEVVKELSEKIAASVDQRLKATDQAWKYGLAAKELVVASPDAAAFFDCVHRAIVELHGELAAEVIKARAVTLMDAKA